MIDHPIPPLFDSNSQVLILGSFPSVRSREQGFFYGHPQNRFWRVISMIFGKDVPVSVEEKKRLLLDNHIAVWDVIGSCDIVGSSDASIRNVTANDQNIVLEKADIRSIYTNGKTAYRYYVKYTQSMTGRPAICLPSTSPANAAWDLKRLVGEWKCITENIRQ